MIHVVQAQSKPKATRRFTLYCSKLALKLPLIEKIQTRHRERFDELKKHVLDFFENGKAKIPPKELELRLKKTGRKEKELLWASLNVPLNAVMGAWAKETMRLNPETVIECNLDTRQWESRVVLLDTDNVSETGKPTRSLFGKVDRSQSIYQALYGKKSGRYTYGDYHRRLETLTDILGGVLEAQEGKTKFYISPVKELKSWIENDSCKEMPDGMQERLQNLNDFGKRVVWEKVNQVEHVIFGRWFAEFKAKNPKSTMYWDINNCDAEGKVMPIPKGESLPLSPENLGHSEEITENVRKKLIKTKDIFYTLWPNSGSTKAEGMKVTFHARIGFILPITLYIASIENFGIEKARERGIVAD